METLKNGSSFENIKIIQGVSTGGNCIRRVPFRKCDPEITDREWWYSHNNDLPYFLGILNVLLHDNDSKFASVENIFEEVISSSQVQLKKVNNYCKANNIRLDVDKLKEFLRNKKIKLQR